MSNQHTVFKFIFGHKGFYILNFWAVNCIILLNRRLYLLTMSAVICLDTVTAQRPKYTQNFDD